MRSVLDLNAWDTFLIAISYLIVDKHEIPLWRRSLYKEIADNFSFPSDALKCVISSAETKRYSECTQKPSDAYSEDLAIITLLTWVVLLRYTHIDHKNLDVSNIISEDRIEYVLANVLTVLDTFLISTITNCTAESSFS